MRAPEQIVAELEKRLGEKIGCVEPTAVGLPEPERGLLLELLREVHEEAKAERRPCPSPLTCGRRAPVQGEMEAPRGQRREAGTIAWAEHLEAYAAYSKVHGTAQSAERIAERHGFGYFELCDLLGHDPKTWARR